LKTRFPFFPSTSFLDTKRLKRVRNSEIAVYSLDAGVIFKRVLTEFPSDTRLLEATEGCLTVEHVVVVDPDGTGLNASGGAESPSDVLRKDGCGETVHGVVCLRDDVVLILELADDDDRTEDLLLRDLGVGRNVGEDGRLDEVTFGPVTFSSEKLGRSLIDTGLDVSGDSVVLEL